MVLEEGDRLNATIHDDLAAQSDDRRAGQLTPYTCPDCGGTLWQQGSGKHLGFRCHVGHRWSPDYLLAQKSDEVETILWAAVRLLVEKETMTRQLASGLRSEGKEEFAIRVDELADIDERYQAVIRELLETTPNPTSQAIVVAQALADAASRDGQ